MVYLLSIIPKNQTDQKSEFENLNHINSSESNSEFFENEIRYKNISQFDIEESARMKFISNILNINHETLLFDIPLNWDAEMITASIDSIYTSEEIIREDGKFSESIEPWIFNSDYLNNSGPYSTENITNDYGYDDLNNNVYINYVVNSTEIPLDYGGMFEYIYENYDHTNFSLTSEEIVNPATEVFPIDDDFLSDPGYDVNFDPFGTSKEDSEVFAYWDPISEALRTDVDVTDAYFYRGDPSISLSTSFFIPFEADNVEITYRWAVENLGYYKQSNFQIKSRIDNQYVDGRTGSNGEDYSDMGTETSLEFDDGSKEIESHDYVERTYNITELVNIDNANFGWHLLEFGCYMQNPTFSTNDVNVFWDSIKITANHSDWYYAGSIDFDYFLENIENTQNIDQNNLGLIIQFGDLNNSNNYFKYIVNNTVDLTYDSWNHVELKIPHIYEEAFSVLNFGFSIGIYNINPYDNRFTPFSCKLSIDCIEINIREDFGSAEDLNLNAKLIGITDWFQWSSHMNLGVSDYPSDIQIEFYSESLTGIDNPYIHFESAEIFIKKNTKNKAEATVNVVDLKDDYCVWNISYSNNDSLNELDDLSFINSKLFDYNITYLNLPALDGLGALSNDWQIFDVISPIGSSKFHNINIRSQDNNYFQNITCVNATSGNSGSLVRGIWCIKAYQQNYMISGDIKSIDHVSTEIFYDGDETNYTMNIRDSLDLIGNYTIQIYNHSGELHSDFPQYYWNIGNLTSEWTVVDQGVGNYSLVINWCHIDENNQTYQIGWWYDSFQVNRKVYSTLFTPIQIISPGEIAEYLIEINQSIDQSGIVDGNIYAINTDLNQLWGLEKPPNIYQVAYMLDLGKGLYKIGLKTTNVDIKNYTIHFEFVKDFYDLHRSENASLNISTEFSSNIMEIEYISGAFRYSPTELFVPNQSISRVNNTFNPEILIKVKDFESNALRDVSVTAKFNGSTTLMIAIEKYALTLEESDKGIYILKLDTLGLNVTDNILHFNYSVDIVFSKPSYLPVYHILSTSITPISIDFLFNEELVCFEGQSFEIKGLLYLEDNSNLIPYNSTILNYYISNSSDELVSGTLICEIGNFFRKFVEIERNNYLYPGEYYLTINTTNRDVVFNDLEIFSFHVLEKNNSQLILIVPDEIRINSFISIAARLSYANSTCIPYSEISITINYSSSYSYEISLLTDLLGKAIFQFSIPQQYQGNNLTIYANFLGSEDVCGSNYQISKLILGKIPVDLYILNTPPRIQVGYNATFDVELSIQNYHNYEGEIVYLYAFYDDSDSPFIIQELSTDISGMATYTISEIENNHKNLTIFFEYLGGYSIENQINLTTFNIIPKWNSSIDYVIDGYLNSIPEIVRYGQILNIELTLNCYDDFFFENFNSLSIELKFIAGSNEEKIIYQLNNSGGISLYYQIPDFNDNNFILFINFVGTNKITGIFDKEINFTISEKKMVNIDIQSRESELFFKDIYSFSIYILDQDSIPIPNAEIELILYNIEENVIFKNNSIQTNSEGYLRFQIDFSEVDSGYYLLQAFFNGNGIYKSSEIVTINFELTTKFNLFLNSISDLMIFIIILIFLSLLLYRKIYYPKIKRKREFLEANYQRLENVENLLSIIVITKFGHTIYSKSFSDSLIDENLISGFITAISNFGYEIEINQLKPDYEGENLEALSYKHFKVIVDDKKDVRTAILLVNNPHASLKGNLNRFNANFQENYLEYLQNFDGLLPPEKPIEDLIEIHFETNLLKSYLVDREYLRELNLNVILKKNERKILKEMMKPRFEGKILIKYFIEYFSNNHKDKLEIFELIDRLINLQILKIQLPSIE